MKYTYIHRVRYRCDTNQDSSRGMAVVEQQMLVKAWPLTVPLSQAGYSGGHWLLVGEQEMG